MRVVMYKYILRDLETMKKVGHTYAVHGQEPVAPRGMFVSKCVGSFVETRAENIIEV
jgi:hypothetical protein